MERDIESRARPGLAGLLDGVVRKGFERIRQYLDVEAEGDVEILRQQSDLADRLIKTQVRLDESVLRAESDGRFLTVLEELARVEALPVPGKKS